MTKHQPKNLLIIKNRALGDSVITFGTIQYLKELLPETRIIYAVPNWIAPLYQNLNTKADKIISLDFKDFASWRESRKVIKEERVDTVLELFQSGRTEKFFKMIRLLAGPKYYFHNHHKKTGPVHDQGIIKANIQRDLDAAWTYFGNSKVPAYQDFYPSLRLKSEVRKEKLITLGVVATRKTKMWPLSSYIALANLILKNNPEYKIQIPLGPGDTKIERELIRLGLPPNVSLLKISLSDLPIYLAKAIVYVGNDTGIKHISVALNIPTITLFGPEPPKEWHPYNIEEHPFFFKEPLECRTIISHYCGLSTCDSMICLNGFLPSEVYQKLLNFI